MLTFKSPANSDNTWKLYLRTNKEMVDIFYEGTEPEDGTCFFGITEYPTSKVYINKDLDGFLLLKTLRHELMHIYLWEIGKKKDDYTEDEVCEAMSVVAPLICKIADDIALRLKKKNKEKTKK